MKLLVDMNRSPRWVPFLREADWEAVHWSTVGMADASDSEIMAFAAERICRFDGRSGLRCHSRFLSSKKTQRGADSRRRPSP